MPIACGAREFVTSSTGGHFDSAGPDKKRDAMSCELDNATNNDPCTLHEHTGISRHTPIYTLVHFCQRAAT